jgi:hypothetical protein
MTKKNSTQFRYFKATNVDLFLDKYPFIYLWIYRSFMDLGRFFSFLIIYAVDRAPWTGDQPVVRPLPALGTAQTQNKRTQTSMPQVGFEPTIPVFERAKTVHALDRAAAVIGRKIIQTMEKSLIL